MKKNLWVRLLALLILPCMLLTGLSSCSAVKQEESMLRREEILVFVSKYQGIVDAAVAQMQSMESLRFVSTTQRCPEYFTPEQGAGNTLYIGVEENGSIVYKAFENEALANAMKLSGVVYIAADENSYEFFCGSEEEDGKTVSAGLIYSKNVSALLGHFDFPATSISQSETGFISYRENDTDNCYYEYIYGKYYYYRVTQLIQK